MLKAAYVLHLIKQLVHECNRIIIHMTGWQDNNKTLIKYVADINQ